MEEEVQELKHVCKVCNKTFPCGRSLGGHMRSHVINTAESDQNLTKKKLSSLRENPKKAFRFTGSNGETLPHNKLCKECGRGFQSWKALFGHMKCHSERFSNTIVEEEEEEEDSWTSSASRSDNPKEGSSRRGTRTRRYMMGTANSLHIANNINNASSSSVSVIEQDQEEVAMCLIMLSKDVGNKRSGLNSVDESSDNNFELLQPKSSTIPRNLESSVLGSLNSKFDTSGVSRNGLLRNDHKTNNKDSKLGKNLMKERRFDQSAAEISYGDCGSGKRSKFECTTCNKTFHSYQALGGHRASHKKVKGCSFASKIDSSAENSIETAEISPAPKSHNNEDPIDEEEDASYVVLSKKINNNKGGGHECPICFKVFSSGQALGGHKRSHLICGGGGGPKINQTIVIHQKPNVPEIRDLLDLNLPAPVEEESSSGFKPWWVADNLKQDQLFGLLS